MKSEVVEVKNDVIKFCPKPVLSVVICTYNQKKYIEQTIDGVLSQITNFPLELIIGDDESDDGTREVCNAYAKKYPQIIRLFLHKRINNILIQGRPTITFQFLYNCFSSRGDYLAFLAGDDYWTDPTKLQKQYTFLTKNIQYSASFHNFYILKEYVSEADNKRIPGYDRLYYPEKFVQLSRRPLTIMCLNIFTEVPEQFAEVLAEDVFLRFLLETKGKFKYHSDIDGAVYRIHTSSAWSTQSNIFKASDSVLSYSKILDAFKGTRFQKLAEVMLIKSLIYKVSFDGSGSTLIKILKEIHKMKVSYFSLIYYIVFSLKIRVKKIIFSLR
jgi:glycosyltransferase involved in cell wall biosynthesis